MEREGDENFIDEKDNSGKKPTNSSGKPVGQILIDG